jgi:uncharacterized secreted protein with C-terminal beta-propeller domain
MKRHQRRHGALRRLGQAGERLEPRQFLAGDGFGIALLPVQFDPAIYADMGPQPPSAEASLAPSVAAASGADAQSRFSSAEELENYLLDAAVKRYEYALGKTFDYNPFGLWYGVYHYTLATDFGSTRTESHTSTNVQEGGVDEADLVETDGEYIYLVQGEELLIFDAKAVEQPRLLSRTKIDGTATGIYLDGDRLTVISQDNSFGILVRPQLRTSIWPGPGTQRGSLNVTVFDVADQSMPKLVSQTELDGYLVSSRQVEGRLYLTINAGLEVPQPVATQIAGGSDLPRWQVETAEAYRARVRPLLQASLPHYNVRTVGNDGPRQLLSDPTEIYKPSGPDDTNLTSVVVIDTRAAKPAPIGSASVLGTTGQMIYASADNLYVLSTRWLQEWGPAGGTKTEIRKFHFTATGIELAATGEVDGTVLNQFSLSEHAGHLRVATTEGWGETAKNHLFVLGEQGDELTVVGALRDLAPGERIFSTRLLGNRGFIVTFRQVDPLFSLDLSDPTNPRVVGELKLPGFSNYLQVLDENTVLGIGRDADPVTGQQGALMITIFDVSNAAQPRVKDQFKFESNYWTTADYDHLQVLYDPEFHTLAIPVSGALTMRTMDLNWRMESELWVFDVSPSLGIELRGKVVQSGQVLRSLRIEDVLYSISTESILAAPVLQPETKLAEVVYNRDFVGLQIDPFSPDKFNVVLRGGATQGQYEAAAAEGGRVEIKRGGVVIGVYDQEAIGSIIVSSMSGNDHLLVKNRRAISAKIEPTDWGMSVDLGDIDQDGVVGLADFGLLKSQMGQQGVGLASDVDRDGDVDLDDLGILSSNFGVQAERPRSPIVIMPFDDFGLLRPEMNAVAIDLVLAANESLDDDA